MGAGAAAQSGVRCEGGVSHLYLATFLINEYVMQQQMGSM